jgi:branched-subunit amino acid ABC-type transport system permease component
MSFVQIILNAVIFGSQLGLLALGLTMIYSILRFANFAHGELALVGAYLTYLFSVNLKLHFLLALIFSIGLTGIVAVLSDRLIFKKLREAPALALIIASLGLSISVRHIMSAIWGPDPLGYKQALAKVYHFWGAHITSTQLIILVVAGSAMIFFHLLLHRTKLGKAMRALSDNRSLAQDRGIDVERIITWVWFICGCYAGLGGVLIALETALWPELGFQIILPVFCAAILGGVGNVYGAVAGALVLGFAENIGLSVNWSSVIDLFKIFGIERMLFIPTEYKTAISFLILVLVLILFPTGIMKGRRGH